MPYIYFAVSTSLKQHRDSCLEPRRCSTKVFKIEINLHGKISTGYHLSLVVKVIPDFDGHGPTKILLFLFCGIYFRFRARLLR